jgi:hypothetical protein
LVVNNQLGEARANATLTAVTSEPLHLDPMHEQSLARIQGLEAYKSTSGLCLVTDPRSSRVWRPYAEDSGVYKVVAQNELGSMDLGSMRCSSSRSIAELEQPRDLGCKSSLFLCFSPLSWLYLYLHQIPDRECETGPQFLGELTSVEVNEYEDVNIGLQLIRPVNGNRC